MSLLAFCSDGYKTIKWIIDILLHPDSYFIVDKAVITWCFTGYYEHTAEYVQEKQVQR